MTSGSSGMRQWVHQQLQLHAVGMQGPWLRQFWAPRFAKQLSQELRLVFSRSLGILSRGHHVERCGSYWHFLSFSILRIFRPNLKGVKAVGIGFARLLFICFYTLKLQKCCMHNPVEYWYSLAFWTELLASTSLRNGLHRWRGMVGFLWSNPQCNKHADLPSPVATVCHTNWKWTWHDYQNAMWIYMKYMLIWGSFLLPLPIYIDVRSTTFSKACSGFACIHWPRAQFSLLVAMQPPQSWLQPVLAQRDERDSVIIYMMTNREWTKFNLAKFLKTNQAPFLETIVYVRCPRRGYDCSKATDPGQQDLFRNTCES